MSSLPYFNYEPVGALQTQNFHYSQAVRIGDRIEASGQGGWHNDAQEVSDIVIPIDLAAEIEQAFVNVDVALKAAGGQGWSQVYKVRSYHVGKPGEVTVDGETLGIFIKALANWTPNHKPLLTLLGVSSLGKAGMRVEIEVEAYDPKQ